MDLCVCCFIDLSNLASVKGRWQPAAFRFSPPAPTWSVAWFV